jgi:hypothetical protein
VFNDGQGKYDDDLQQFRDNETRYGEITREPFHILRTVFVWNATQAINDKVWGEQVRALLRCLGVQGTIPGKIDHFTKLAETYMAKKCQFGIPKHSQKCVIKLPCAVPGQVLPSLLTSNKFDEYELELQQGVRKRIPTNKLYDQLKAKSAH